MLGYQPFVVNDTLKFEPGSKFKYSSNAMLLLGVVIEKVSGQSYYDYVQDHIFIPADMQNSGSYDTRVPVKNVATGYDKNKDGLWQKKYSPVARKR